MSTQKVFIEKIAPGAQEAMKSYGILASLTIAQAILESGWGLFAPGNNLFGIKAYGWSGKTQILTTGEYLNGKTVIVKDIFRAYGSWAESIKDHTAFLVKNSRYRNIIGVGDYKTVCNRIKADGYATAKDYDRQLVSIIEQYGLCGFDRLPGQIYIDAPKQNAVCTGNINIIGWAIAPKGVSRVEICADGKQKLADISLFSDRPDVNAAMNRFGWYQKAAKSGFHCTIPAGKIKKGRHTIDVAAIGCDRSVTWAHRSILIK